MRRPWVLSVAALLAGVLLVVLLPQSFLFVPEQERGPAAEGELSRYACPMLCTIRTSPGDCPVCGMDMTEIRDTGDQIPLSVQERKMIGLQTSEATFRTLWRSLRTVGRIEADETRVREVAAWTAGRIDRLYADFTGFVVQKGDPLFEIYSPLIYESQQSFISALESLEAATDPRGRRIQERNVASMRRRLELLGLAPKQVEALAASGVPTTQVAVAAPIGGTIIDKRVHEGQYVKEGQTLAIVADLSRLWVKMDVFEEDLPWISVGQPVRVTTRALPTEILDGTIAFIDPELDPRTRAVEARVEVANEGAGLRPGMFAQVEARVPLDYDGRPHLLSDSAEDLPKVLAVPESAVLSTGTRHLVFLMVSPPRYVEEADGTRRESSPAVFEGREVGVGPLADDGWPILSGLRPGDRVATRGSFLIDSQMQLSGRASLMRVPPASESTEASATGTPRGK